MTDEAKTVAYLATILVAQGWSRNGAVKEAAAIVRESVAAQKRSTATR